MVWVPPLSRLVRQGGGFDFSRDCSLGRLRQKLDQRPIKLLRTLLVRQVPHTRKHNLLRPWKISRQRFHRRKVNRGVLGSPHQQRRNRAQLRQQILQFPQVRAPSLHDTERVFEQSGNRQGSLVAFETIGRN